jgi:hypothetical protein
VISHHEFYQKFEDFTEQSASSISFSEGEGCRCVRIVTKFLLDYVVKYALKMPTGDILTKSFPAAYENKCVLLYIVLTSKMFAISLCTTEPYINCPFFKMINYNSKWFLL